MDTATLNLATVTVTVPETLFGTIELPALPEGFSWEVKFYGVGYMMFQDADVWELHIIDKDGVTITFDNPMTDDYNLTEGDLLASADYLLGRI